MNKHLFLFLLFSSSVIAQQKPKPRMAAVIAFYNVENLYDTINSVDVIHSHFPMTDSRRRIALAQSSVSSDEHFYDTRDEDFTVDGNYVWNATRYQTKLARLAEVVAQLGMKETQNAPSILGLAEIENSHVLEDLVSQEKLKPFQYGIIHFNSPDERGVDVALLYQTSRFRPLLAQPIELMLVNDKGKRDYTRDILMVKGLLDGESFCFFVNHWPSRRGGEARSSPLREKAAALCKKYVDSIQHTEPQTKIVLMGDFNDDPNNRSVFDVLGAKGAKAYTQEKNGLYNPYWDMFKRGGGTLAYNDRWNLFDQIILSPNLVGNDYTSYQFRKSLIFNPSFLLQSSGNFKYYPWRTYVGATYTGGYSDHMPVYVLLVRDLP